MESLEQISQRIAANIEQSKSNSIALSARVSPMDTNEIERMNKAIDSHFEVRYAPRHGYVPIMVDGERVKDEYDLISEDYIYTPNPDGDIPQQLWDAMMRPALRQHLIYHLTRLAAHRRHTQGGEMLGVFIEDLSFDLKNISEWAVIMACAEMRRRRTTWYPDQQEIRDTIEKNSAMIKNLYAKRLESTSVSKPKSKFDKSLYFAKPQDNPMRRAICDFIIQKGGEDYFESGSYSNYQLQQMAESKYGWKEEAA